MAAYAALTNYLPGTASLIEEIDKKLLVVLRDGRTLIGWLRSIDQFANLVLHRCVLMMVVGVYCLMAGTSLAARTWFGVF